MYKTKEIRWFFAHENKHIENWFKNLEFDTFQKRKDFYLHLEKEDVGVKLREGMIEVKHRTGARSRGCSGRHAWGYYEYWTKWSFNAESDAGILSEITGGNRERWTSVVKERKSVKLTLKSGQMVIKSPMAEMEYGCQIEYSKIKVKAETWYTFGLEWFGETCMELNASLLTEILGDTKLSMNRSMGYPAFLKTLQSSKKRMSMAVS